MPANANPAVLPELSFVRYPPAILKIGNQRMRSNFPHPGDCFQDFDFVLDGFGKLSEQPQMFKLGLPRRIQLPITDGRQLHVGRAVFDLVQHARALAL